MIIAPAASLDLVIQETLAELRKGIASARQKNQNNPATGLMADLPEFIDFEIQVITDHQSSSFARTTSNDESTSFSGSDIAVQASAESSVETETGTQTGTETGAQVGTGTLTRTETGTTTGTTTQTQTETGTRTGTETGTETGTGTQTGTQTETQTGTRTSTQTVTDTNSGRQTARKNKTDGNSRAYGALDEDSGEYVASGELNLNPPILNPLPTQPTCGT